MPEGQAAYVDGYSKVSTIPVGLPTDVAPGTPMRAQVTVETASIRYRYTGNTPLSQIGGGHLLAAGQTLVIEGNVNVTQFQMVRAAGTDADVFFTLESI